MATTVPFLTHVALESLIDFSYFQPDLIQSFLVSTTQFQFPEKESKQHLGSAVD